MDGDSSANTEKPTSLNLDERRRQINRESARRIRAKKSAEVRDLKQKASFYHFCMPRSRPYIPFCWRFVLVWPRISFPVLDLRPLQPSLA